MYLDRKFRTIIKLEAIKIIEKNFYCIKTKEFEIVTKHDLLTAVGMVINISVRRFDMANIVPINYIKAA